MHRSPPLQKPQRWATPQSGDETYKKNTIEEADSATIEEAGTTTLAPYPAWPFGRNDVRPIIADPGLRGVAGMMLRREAAGNEVQVRTED